ncbi:uncharacterized protein ASCRUDRAFT_76675 [Ascoidea rubescens DSM 1968]|uniref:Uncharacterized protein n=1 Tax=Ascoidea rubescens DSM 1968 TaxID=1344418 RepID=A0A1D2VEW9_9ASCO|nr:hypothetical protein ASCRUDRAFT_76675 [Ascoidea rubescens DSM 1968]ODV60176.1 hypothetical protein ASCRUDRAFT_76675 [Ascoidea rubescens DSM 1968]
MNCNSRNNQSWNLELRTAPSGKIQRSDINFEHLVNHALMVELNVYNCILGWI